MKNVKTKSLSYVRTFMLVLMGAWAFSCENENVTELSRPASSLTLPVDNGLVFQWRCFTSDPAVAAIHIDYNSFPIHVLLPGDPSPHFNFTIDFTNVGSADWNTAGAFFQCYRSKDAILDNSDLPAGGAVLSPTGTPPILSNGGIQTEHWYNTVFVPDYASYPYLIVKLNLPAGTGNCSTSNDVLAEHITFNILQGNAQ